MQHRHGSVWRANSMHIAAAIVRAGASACLINTWTTVELRYCSLQQSHSHGDYEPRC